MREKIAEIIKGYDDDWEDPCYRSADAILALICEEIGKVLLTDDEADNCTPSTEQVEAYLAEPDDEVAAGLRVSYPTAFRIIGRFTLYGRNIAQAQLDKILALLQKEAP